jgi:AraC-like DNA-binding protein
MPESILGMPETNIVGPTTREWAITASVCAALASRHIRAVGMSNVGEGYRIIRHQPGFSHINVCLEGAGCVWSGNDWIRFPAGTVGIFPSGVPHGSFYNGALWRMSWVIYDESPAKRPCIPGDTISFLSIDPRPLEWALLSLYHEVSGPNQRDATSHLAELLHLHVQRAVHCLRPESRLASLWETVNEHLAAPWTARELARLSQMSEVHLRRLSLAEVGRSPLQHLAYLRMRRAEYLLGCQGYTIETASWAVGYRSASAFTRAFKRWIGGLPRSSSDARSRQRPPENQASGKVQQKAEFTKER